MKRFVEGEDRPRSLMLPESLGDCVRGSGRNV